MATLGEIVVPVKLRKGRDPVDRGCSIEEMYSLVAAARNFKGQPPLEDDGKVRVSFNSVHFIPNAINVGFLDMTPWDIEVHPLEFTRYGIPFPPNTIDEFHCYGFAHRVRSDCELTHFFENVYNILKPGGTCFFRVIGLLELMQRCLDSQTCDNDLHLVERQLFTGQDRSGLYFNQCSFNRYRIKNRMRHAGFSEVEVTEGTVDNAVIPQEPDHVWLREFGVDLINKCLDGDTCIMCDTPRTTKPYRPTERSIYCKKHYRKANQLYLDRLHDRLAIHFSATKQARLSSGATCAIPEECIPQERGDG